MKTSRKKLLTVILLIGWIFSNINFISESGGKIGFTTDDPNTTELSLPVNPLYFTFGPNLGEFLILEVTAEYQTPSGLQLLLNDTVNYTLIFQDQLELRFFETITHPNGTIKSSSWYNRTKENLSIPSIFTTTNTTLILDTFADTYWNINVNSTSIHFHKDVINYTSISSMIVDYIFDKASGWVTWLRQDHYFHNGTLYSSWKSKKIDPLITTPTTTNPSTINSTTEATTEDTTTESTDDTTTDNSSSQNTTTQPTIELTFGGSYLISLFGMGIIIFRRKRNR
jgi:hypothetical protein